MSDFKIQTYGKSQMAKMYGVSLDTFRSWCVPAIFSQEEWGNRQLLKPEEVRKIIEKLGEPG